MRRFVALLVFVAAGCAASTPTASNDAPLYATSPTTGPANSTTVAPTTLGSTIAPAPTTPASTAAPLPDAVAVAGTLGNNANAADDLEDKAVSQADAFDVAQGTNIGITVYVMAPADRQAFHDEKKPLEQPGQVYLGCGPIEVELNNIDNDDSGVVQIYAAGVTVNLAKHYPC